MFVFIDYLAPDPSLHTVCNDGSVSILLCSVLKRHITFEFMNLLTRRQAFTRICLQSGSQHVEVFTECAHRRL